MGLGELAEEFDRRGWQVAGCSRSEESLQNLSMALGNSHCLVQTDVTQAQQVDAFAEVLQTGNPSTIIMRA